MMLMQNGDAYGGGNGGYDDVLDKTRHVRRGMVTECVPEQTVPVTKKERKSRVGIQ
jgi:hypothetical protein